MKKEEDIFKMYSDMDEMLESIDLDKQNDTKSANNISKIDISDMPDFSLNTEEKNALNEQELTPSTYENKKDEIDVSNDLVKEKQKHKKRKQKKNSKGWVVTFAILDALAIICLFLMYGPISYFRNLWVTSAMTTMSHKYLAYVFFNQNQINYIMSNNNIIEVEGETNQEEIEFENKEEQIQYSSIYEEQVLKRDPGNDLYKVIDIEGNGYKGHMLVVYDPSKIHLVKTPSFSYGLTIEQFVEKNNAIAGINAGGFNYSDGYGYTPTGVMIIDSEIICDNGSTGWGGGIIGFTNDDVLVLTKASANEAINMGIRDAVSFGPFLIVNGVASEFTGNGGYGIAPRTAIGQRKDGIVLMLVIDGRRAGHSLGVDMVELTNIMLNYGAYNASNLDGGGSSTIVVEGETLSIAGGYGYTGDRYLPNAWLLEG